MPSAEARTTVCHLIDASVGTAYFRALATHHDRSRFRLLIGSLAPAGELQVQMAALDVETFSLDAPTRRHYPVALARLVRLLRQREVDVLHAHCFDPTALAMVADLFAPVEATVFTRHHSDHNIRLGKRWHVLVDGWCGRRADRVIAVSEATRQIMQEVEHVPGRQVTVVYNGMDPIPPVDPGDVARLRSELGIDGRPTALVVGRLHEEKGHAVLLDALPAVLESFPSTRVFFAGEGELRATLEAEIERRGLGDVVHLLGQRADVPALVRAVDVVLLPSLAESFGFAALEAMALGRPVVASRHGGLPEVVLDEETGILVEPGDPASLASAISRIFGDPELARRLSERGRYHAARFDAGSMVRGYEAVYDELLSRS